MATKPRKIMLFTEWCGGSDPQCSSVVISKETWQVLMEEMDARGKSIRASITWYNRNTTNNAAVLAKKKRKLQELFDLMEKLSLEIEEI